jgi:hypothetical protein
MHGEDAPSWARWLEASALGALARSEGWTYAAANTLHILGLAALFGAILAFDLRVLGRGARVLPLGAAEAALLPIARAGFALVAVSGLVLLAADATHVAVNPAFQAKLALILLALLNVALFHRLLAHHDRGPALRASAAASLLLWTAVIASGRMIAYL